MSETIQYLCMYSTVYVCRLVSETIQSICRLLSALVDILRLNSPQQLAIGTSEVGVASSGTLACVEISIDHIHTHSAVYRYRRHNTDF